MSKFINLPVCNHCGTVQHPPREICRNCLSEEVTDQKVDSSGILLSKVNISHSLESEFASARGWPIGTIQLGDKTILLAHLLDEMTMIGSPVHVLLVNGFKDRPVFVATHVETGDITWENLTRKRKK